jgi:hypothetical protein
MGLLYSQRGNISVRRLILNISSICNMCLWAFTNQHKDIFKIFPAYVICVCEPSSINIRIYKKEINTPVLALSMRGSKFRHRYTCCSNSLDNSYEVPWNLGRSRSSLVVVWQHVIEQIRGQRHLSCFNFSSSIIGAGRSIFGAARSPFIV